MQNRQNAARYLKDAGKALLLGLAAAAAVFAVLFLVGLCTHGFAPLAGLDLARRGLFLVGALALLVSAGSRFSRLGLFGVLFCAAVVILAAGSLLDALLFRLV